MGPDTSSDQHAENDRVPMSTTITMETVLAAVEKLRREEPKPYAVLHPQHYLEATRRGWITAEGRFDWPRIAHDIAQIDGCDHHFELTEDGYRCVHCDALRVPHNDGDPRA